MFILKILFLTIYDFLYIKLALTLSFVQLHFRMNEEDKKKTATANSERRRFAKRAVAIERIEVGAKKQRSPPLRIENPINDVIDLHNHKDEPLNQSDRGQTEAAKPLIGAALVLGFLFMFLVDQLSKVFV